MQMIKPSSWKLFSFYLFHFSIQHFSLCFKKIHVQKCNRRGWKRKSGKEKKIKKQTKKKFSLNHEQKNKFFMFHLFFVGNSWCWRSYIQLLVPCRQTLRKYKLSTRDLWEIVNIPLCFHLLLNKKAFSMWIYSKTVLPTPPSSTLVYCFVYKVRESRVLHGISIAPKLFRRLEWFSYTYSHCVAAAVVVGGSCGFCTLVLHSSKILFLAKALMRTHTE